MATKSAGSAYRFESALQERVEHSKFQTQPHPEADDPEEAQMEREEGVRSADDPESPGFDPQMAAPESGTNHEDPSGSPIDRSAGPDEAGQSPPEASGEDF